ncbi:MAG: anaerobic ribonucleoside-triphosphate reductase activating protein [Vallitaleaceae bacterium]|jgi:pyruvate formate lyase activating enzyme|nr:anaerobic ribonucleoside-triphosphate reductase activating protein [Vallitaleaceae bacterium]
MNIAGLTKTTLLDYPNHVACTVYIHGCNLNCPFCHNGQLLSVNNKAPLAETAIFEFLIKRRNVLDGICITGGEPTLQPGLIPFIKKVKALGMKIKLDTNGLKPKVLAHLIEDNLIDYIAMDIKNSKEHYPRTVGINTVDITKINQSIGLIKASGIPYEFRTTVMREFHTIDGLISIAQWLGRVDNYTLQNYKKSDNQLTDVTYTAFEKSELETYRTRLSPYYLSIKVK